MKIERPEYEIWLQNPGELGVYQQIERAGRVCYKSENNTAFGILTSWCAVVSYNTFTNKVDKLTYALDEVGYSIAQTYEANHAEEA